MTNTTDTTSALPGVDTFYDIMPFTEYVEESWHPNPIARFVIRQLPARWVRDEWMYVLAYCRITGVLVQARRDYPARWDEWVSLPR